MTVPSDFQIIFDQFVENLRGAGKSPRTIETYTESVAQFQNFLSGIPDDLETTADITPGHISRWMIALEEAGRKRSTRNNRGRGLQAFFKFMVAIKEIDVSPMVLVEIPSPGKSDIDTIPDDWMAKLVATCGTGKDRSFEDIRDEAIIRLFRSTGMRRNEMVTPKLTDLDMNARTIHVAGKGDGDGPRFRLLPFGPKTALALDKYRRARARHPKADSTDALWIGRFGPLTASGIKALVDRRCRLAEIPHIHPHQFRHSYSDEWLAKGGEEGDLMAHNGWKSRAMVDRYAANRKDIRAREAYRRLQPGEDY